MTAHVRRPPVTEAGLHRESAEYVVDMVRELVAIAQGAGLEAVACMLTIAQAEAEKALDLRRH